MIFWLVWCALVNQQLCTTALQLTNWQCLESLQIPLRFINCCAFTAFRNPWPGKLGQRSCWAMGLSHSLLQNLLRDETFTFTSQRLKKQPVMLLHLTYNYSAWPEKLAQSTHCETRTHTWDFSGFAFNEWAIELAPLSSKRMRLFYWILGLCQKPHINVTTSMSTGELGNWNICAVPPAVRKSGINTAKRKLNLRSAKTHQISPGRMRSYRESVTKVPR